jgi:hypothetical protein
MNIPPAVKDLWKDKPLLITVAVGIAVLLYILYKNNSATLTAPAAPSDTASSNVGAGPGPGSGTFVEESVNITSPVGNTSTTIYNPLAPAQVSLPIKLPMPITPVATSTPKAPAPQPAPVAASSTGGGLLGPGIRFFPNYVGNTAYYRGPKTGGKIIPVPVPAGTTFQPGANGRVWYQTPGTHQGQLLTSGNG